MTATKNVTLWCEAEGCLQWIEVATRHVEVARREAKESGWRISFGKDYCSAHGRRGQPR